MRPIISGAARQYSESKSSPLGAVERDSQLSVSRYAKAVEEDWPADKGPI